MAQTLYTRPAGEKNVRIHDSFFGNLMRLAAEKMIPYQWLALSDAVEGAAPSFCLRNFRAAAGREDAPHDGCVFQDSDLAKWLEAAAHMLEWNRDAETEAHIDEVVDLIGEAQQPDGYLDTYYILTGLDKRWTNLRDHHELYCAGHMLEAAVAYFKATGKRKLLDIMIRLVDHLNSRFGLEEGKIKGYPGHEEIELALVKLYEVTKDPKHLALAKYFIDQRGQSPLYFDEEAKAHGRSAGWNRSIYDMGRYYQANRPVRKQAHAQGHAVRALYLYSGMADVARETGDETLADACRTLWNDVTRRQMYITGAVGQSAFGEAFTFGYDLPNDLVYGETCASIALLFFASRMLRLEARGEYGDIMDKLIYNGTISGMSLSGERFFYVNPLESWPERSEKSQPVSHIKSERQKWFGCACCPPNLARLVASLPGYVFHTRGNTAFFALYTACEAALPLENGEAKLRVETEYPWNGQVRATVESAFPGFEMALRLPGWVKTYTLTVNGESAETRLADGYLYLSRDFKPGDTVEFAMDMPVMAMRAHPRVRADAGKIALQRGPVVYCLEEADNGKNLSLLRVNARAPFACAYEKDTLGGVVTLECDAARETEAGWDEYELYADAHTPAREPVRARFVPYYAWNNRGAGEMCVWVREDQ